MANRKLTERQKNEFEYHIAHALQHADILKKPFSFDVLFSKKRRWWNIYWEMYSFLLSQNLKGKKILVVGCGFGDDALRLSKVGADVEAFDLSPDSLEIAKGLAEREGLSITFKELPAEALNYESDIFDCVIARDILHHVDIHNAMQEIVRVSKSGALLVVNEIYSHSFSDKIRYSRFVKSKLYPLMQKFIYGGGKPYITKDERKLTESDVNLIIRPIGTIITQKYFNFIITRLLPEKFTLISKLDRILLLLVGSLGKYIAGRIFIAGIIDKS